MLHLLSPRNFISQFFIGPGKFLGALLNARFQVVVCFPQCLRDSLAFRDLGREGLIGLREACCVFRFPLEDGMHAYEEAHEHEDVLREDQHMSSEERRVEYLVGGGEENQMSRCPNNEGTHKPVFKSAGVPATFEERSQAKNT